MAASPGCTEPLLTPRSLCPPPQEQLLSKQSGRGKQFTPGNSTACSSTLPSQLSCHKGWELFGCLHSASHQLSRTSSPCAGALICPFSIISSREVKPLTNQTNEEVKPLTNHTPNELLTISEQDTRLRSTVTPCQDTSAFAQTGVIPQEHGRITSLEASWGQSVSKPIPSLAVGDVMPVH